MTASESTLRSQNFYRVKQQLQSSGDIFPIDVSTLALYVGPDSDVAELIASYYDPSVANTQQNQATLSPGAPFVGRTDALNGQQYPVSGQPAQILVSLSDIINNTYTRPQPLQPANTVRVLPEIDLIAVIGSDLPQVPALRSDKVFRSPAINVDPGTAFTDSTDLIVPIYARRLITATVDIPPFTALDITFEGVNLQAGLDTAPVTLATMSFPSTTVTQTDTVALTASALGTFDLLIVNFIDNVGAVGVQTAAITLRASDREA